MWRVVLSPAAQKQLKKVSSSVEIEIIRYLETCIETSEDPRRFGKALSANLVGLWRYRIGDYRLICKIQNNELIVLVLKIAHRREVYR